MRDEEEEYDRSVVCLFCFCMSYEELSTHPCPPFSLFVFLFRFRLFTFQPPLQRASLAKAVWKLFDSLEKGGGLPQASRRDFLKKDYKKVHYLLIPQSARKLTASS